MFILLVQQLYNINILLQDAEVRINKLFFYRTRLPLDLSSVACVVLDLFIPLTHTMCLCVRITYASCVKKYILFYYAVKRTLLLF